MDDIEALKKENITIESESNNFNEIYDKIVNLKNRIEKEIDKINKLYDKTIEDLTQSYLKKHEQLLKEENDLKEKLQNEVTKSKEKLENYFSLANNDIKLSERIMKGIEKMKNKDENIIKIISYVSKANKTRNEIINLSGEFMKNIKFHYEEEKSQIKFEEYFFNGIPLPENIEIKDITGFSCSVSWDIKQVNLLDFDLNKMKYKIEVKKENENFQKIYEGNQKQYLINNLNPNINYEIRICSIYDNIIGSWSKIQKFKTKGFDSNILKETNKENEFVDKLLEWTGGKSIELLFRGTRDGMNDKAFYDKCSNKGETIVLIKNEKDNIFGGFSSISWIRGKNDKDNSAPDSFLFTLTNIFNIEPTKFPSKNDQKEIRCYNNLGPLFGNGTDLGIYPDFLNDGGWTHFGDTFPDILGKGRSIFTGDFNKDINTFKIKEIEVFQIIK